MKPKDKEKLVRARPAMVRAMEVEQILPGMRKDDMFNKKDEQFILKDNKRRERVIRFLDVLEKKKTEVYEKFQDVLGDYYPQLLLQLTDWDDDEDDLLASKAQFEDDSMLQRARQYLIHEIDASQVVKYMQDHNALTEAEVASVMREGDPQSRTEVFLDVLELHPPEHYDIFVDAVGESYPHVYLTLTGAENDGNSDDDW